MTKKFYAFYSKRMAQEYPDTVVYWLDCGGNEAKSAEQ